MSWLSDRWRVRATKKGKAGTWDWGLFSFNTASGSPQQSVYDGSGQPPADYPYDQDPYDGSGQQPTDYPYGQDPYDDSGQPPADYPYQDPYQGSEQPQSDVPYAEENPNQGSEQPPADYPYGHQPPSTQEGQQPTYNNPQIKIIPKVNLKKIPIKSTGQQSEGTEGG